MDSNQPQKQNKKRENWEKEQNQQIRPNRKLIAAPGVWCPFMLRVYGCVFSSISLLSVSFFLSFFCLHVCVYASKFEVLCGSAFGPGASGPPYYCTPPVCVSDVLGALAVWWHTKIKKKLRTTCMRLWGNWVATCVTALQNKNKKPKRRTHKSR